MNWLRDLLFNNKISSEKGAVNDELDSHYVLRTNRAKKNINGIYQMFLYRCLILMSGDLF